MTCSDRLKNSRFIQKLLTGGTSGQFIRYAAVGGMSFLLEYSLFYILITVFDIWFVTANVTVYSLVFIFNFLLNRLWSFNVRRDFKKQILRYGALFLFNLAASTAILYMLTDFAGISPLVSKIIVMAAIVPWNFFMYRKYIYR